MYHHHTPQFLLRNFSNSSSEVKPKDKKIWWYDLTNNLTEPRNMLIKEVGGENHFNSITDENGKKETILENELSKIEAGAAILCQKLLEDKPLFPEERLNLSLFFAVMRIRTKRFRTQTAELLIQDALATGSIYAQDKNLFQSFIDYIENQRGTSLTECEKSLYLEDMQNPQRSIENIAIKVDQEITLLLAYDPELLQALTRLIFHLNWTLLYAPKNKFFITSDNPLIVEHMGLGLMDPHLFITLPLTPECCWLGHRSNSIAAHINITSQAFKKLNRIRAIYADKSLFAPQNDSGILKLAQKYKGKSPGMFSVNGLTADQLSVSLMRRKK
jgi:hypothetical protein